MRSLCLPQFLPCERAGLRFPFRRPALIICLFLTCVETSIFIAGCLETVITGLSVPFFGYGKVALYAAIAMFIVGSQCGLRSYISLQG